MRKFNSAILGIFILALSTGNICKAENENRWQFALSDSQIKESAKTLTLYLLNKVSQVVIDFTVLKSNGEYE